MTSEFGIAVHALVFLEHKAAVLSSEELAENVCTNPARVRKVMAKLKKAGLVSTRAGAEGGYLFSGSAQGVTLGQISQAVEARFVASAWRSGDPEMECLVASGMADAMDQVYGELDLLCQKRLGEITLAQISGRVFSRQQQKGSTT